MRRVWFNFDTWIGEAHQSNRDTLTIAWGPHSRGGQVQLQCMDRMDRKTQQANQYLSPEAYAAGQAPQWYYMDPPYCVCAHIPTRLHVVLGWHDSSSRLLVRSHMVWPVRYIIITIAPLIMLLSPSVINIINGIMETCCYIVPPDVGGVLPLLVVEGVAALVKAGNDWPVLTIAAMSAAMQVSTCCRVARILLSTIACTAWSIYRFQAWVAGGLKLIVCSATSDCRYHHRRAHGRCWLARHGVLVTDNLCKQFLNQTKHCCKHSLWAAVTTKLEASTCCVAFISPSHPATMPYLHFLN